MGEHGLLALDWHNGNRSILADANLSNMILGQTLLTKPEDQYRALLEATVFGARVIIENFEQHGVEITEIVAAGGLLKNAFLMQLSPTSVGDRCRRPLQSGARSRCGDLRRRGCRTLPRRFRSLGRHGQRWRTSTYRTRNARWNTTRSLRRGTSNCTTTSVAVAMM